MAESGRLRIGELSRRVGVSPELLRAWETRYGLVKPERTAGGLRIYSKDDERRVREMCDQIAAGLSAAEAARVALGPAAGACVGGAAPQRSRPRSHCARRARCPSDAGSHIRVARPRHGARAGNPAFPKRRGRTLGGEGAQRRAGALRQQRDRWETARPRPRLGCRRRSPCAARLPARRTTRAWAALLRSAPARTRMENRLPRRGDADVRSRDRERAAVARDCGARRDGGAAVPRRR